MKLLRDLLICLVLASGAALLISGVLYLRTLDCVTAELPTVVDAAIAREGAATRQQVDGLSARADWRITAIQHDLFERVDAITDLVGRRSGEALETVNSGIAELHGIRSDLSPVVTGAAALEARYTALPDQIGAQLRPPWLALQPEFTCRQLDGTGYGGCWHSRITGLLGEALKVGGVFTQRFPEFVDSATAINRNFAAMTGDASRWTHKWLDPKPMKTGDYFKAAGKITLGLGTAGLRGGLF